MQYTRIKDVNHLRELLKKDKNDFFICLNGGLRSSKFILLLEDGCFQITNEIDGSIDRLSEEELMNRDITNVGYAITKGAFYCYD